MARRKRKSWSGGGHLALARHHVPFDNTGHVLTLGGEPEGLAIDHAEEEDPGVTFWGRARRYPRVFGWHEFLPVGGAVLIGEARSAHWLRWFLYELPG